MIAIRVLIFTFFYPVYALYLHVKEMPIYITYPRLAWIDCQLAVYYFFYYPFIRHLYQKIKTKKDISELVYGETPYHTLQKAIDCIQFKTNTLDQYQFLDLGCGKGKLVFYVALAYQLPSIGVDVIPTFIAKARQKQVPLCDFIQADFTTLKDEVDWSIPTIVYTAGTCFLPDTQRAILHQCLRLPKGSWVISACEPMTHPDFKIMKEWHPHFGWGKGYLALNQKMH